MAKLGGIWNEKKEDEEVYYFGIEYERGMLRVGLVNKIGQSIKYLFSIDKDGIYRHSNAKNPVILTDDLGRISLVGE